MALPAQTSGETGPAGIGGWLIFPIVWFMGSVVHNGWNVVDAAWRGNATGTLAGANNQLTAVRVWDVLWTPVNFALFLSATLCLYLIFTKKQVFIPVAIAHCLILAVAFLIEYSADRSASEVSAGRLSDAKAGAIGMPLIWAAYFYLSRRVRNTFVEPLWAIAPPAPSPAEPSS